jgi:CheY-like chemotaxis protein
MDHMMPGMDGVEATKIIRDMGYSRPIVVFTANVVKGQAEMFMQSGFSGFMSKPIDIKILNSYLLRFIK